MKPLGHRHFRALSRLCQFGQAPGVSRRASGSRSRALGEEPGRRGGPQAPSSLLTPSLRQLSTQGAAGSPPCSQRSG